MFNHIDLLWYNKLNEIQGGIELNSLDKGPDPRIKIVIIFAAIGAVLVLASIIVGKLG